MYKTLNHFPNGVFLYIIQSQKNATGALRAQSRWGIPTWDISEGRYDKKKQKYKSM